MGPGMSALSRSDYRQGDQWPNFGVSAFGLKTGQSVEGETASHEIAEWNTFAKYSIEPV